MRTDNSADSFSGANHNVLDVAEVVAPGSHNGALRMPRRKSGLVKRNSAGDSAAASAPRSRRRKLRYVDADTSGISRVRHGSGFRYVDARGKSVKDSAQLQRIRALAIPPAWESVWIAQDDRAHIQAHGRDQRGRKQYRYHAEWSAAQDELKYDRLQRFAARLPELRERVRRDLALSGLPRDKVVASAIRLLLESHIRVGNENYAKENGSYGLTTLRNRHIDIEGGRIELSFVGKSGVKHRIVVHDRKAASVLAECRELSGPLLFQCIDADGKIQPIDSHDVNRYLRAVCGKEFSAKDVRTWAGTVMAVETLAKIPNEEAKSRTRRQRELNEALREVAGNLGNTLAVCRKCYVHPGVFDLHHCGTLAGIVKARTKKPPIDGFDAAESATLAILRRIKQARKKNTQSDVGVPAQSPQGASMLLQHMENANGKM